MLITGMTIAKGEFAKATSAIKKNTFLSVFIKFEEYDGISHQRNILMEVRRQGVGYFVRI
jgi:hypothetical protein